MGVGGTGSMLAPTGATWSSCAGRVIMGRLAVAGKVYDRAQRAARVKVMLQSLACGKLLRGRVRVSLAESAGRRGIQNSVQSESKNGLLTRLFSCSRNGNIAIRRACG